MKSKVEIFYKTNSTEVLDRIVRMCWEDRTPFDAISEQFDLSPNEIIKLMRMILPLKDYRRWRERANNLGHLKHQKKRPKEVNRFKCSRERLDGSTKGYK